MQPTRRSSRPRLLQRSLFLLFGLLLVPLGAMAQTGAPAELEGIEEFVERGMQDWGIPGLAVSVVKDDELVWATGFGVRRLGRPDPVDGDTLFNIASVSKAFNAAALGLLVDEGRISWDDPVVKHLAQLQLYDPYVTRAATVRDMLAHRVGLGRLTGNRLRWISSRDRSEQIARLRHLPPEQGFREGYVYSNVLYMVAGEVVPAVTGTGWEQFVEQRLFAPLGMTRSLAGGSRLDESGNVAWPHQEIDGTVVEIPRRNFDAVGPAASVHSSAREIGSWMRLHLGTPGEFEGNVVLAPGTVAEMHRSQTPIQTPAFEALAAYGLGWRLGSHEGRQTSSHSGAVDGMNSLLMLVPEEGLGIFITTNTFNNFTTALARQIVDAYLGIDGRDRHAETFERYLGQKAQAQEEREAIHAARIRNTRPSGPLADFTGGYDDALYADAAVRVADGRLVLQLWDDPEQVADLEHWHHDTFRAVWRNPAMREEFVWFTRGRDGTIDQLHIDWNLRPAVLQVGAYPSSYRREATFKRQHGGE
ncbi:serine hydrolase [Luteimonas sp. A277]